VEVDAFLEDGSFGRAIAPSGASTGTNEAHELRDGGNSYGGLDVLRALRSVQEEIAPALASLDAGDQTDIDAKMIEIDGTSQKSRLGANAILATSLAVAKAEAVSRSLPFWEYLTTLSRLQRDVTLPLPLCNLMNGGRHADGSTDIQEFMVVPHGASSFSNAIRMVAETFHTLKDVLREHGYTTTVGDEGGYAPQLQKGNKEALELLIQAVEQAGYRVGTDMSFALDVAASELVEEGRYNFFREDRRFETEELIEYYASLVEEFSIRSLEDGLGEDDWNGWRALTERIGDKAQIVADDLTVTNVSFLERAIEERAGNAVLVKPNQIGTLTETIDTIDTAHEAGWRAIVSHRSGETEDTTIAHLAVAFGIGQIKTGSLSRSERVAKYNELLRIEEALGERAVFSSPLR
jgi:enolase